MRVLVLGGTGAIGYHLVQLLSEKNVETVVTSRKGRSHNKIHYLQGNAYNIEFLKTLLQEPWDAIVDFMVYSTSDFEKRIKLFLNATSQYIFLSSSRVYAESAQFITEKSPRLLDSSRDEQFLKTDEYSLAKARQENLLIKSDYKNWTIIRPYITYDQNRLQLGVLEKEEWLYRALHGRSIVFPKDIGARITTMTFGLDVSDSIMSIVGRPEALSNIYNITTAEFHSWLDILNVYLEVLEKHLGTRPKVLMNNLDSHYRIHSSQYQILYDRLYDRKFDNTKISRSANTANFRRTEEGLRFCLNEFLKKPSFKEINWAVEAFKDRQTKEYTPLKEIKGFKGKLRYLYFRYLKNYD